MPLVVRKGDANSAGGTVTGPCAPTVLTNNRPTSLPGDSVTPHPCCGVPGCAPHCSAVTTGGSSTVIAEGKPVQYIGCSDSCGHPRVTGSPNVIVGA